MRCENFNFERGLHRTSRWRQYVSFAVLLEIAPKSARLAAAASFDHFIGAGEEVGRDRQVEGSCSLQVDHKLELGWLLHR